MKGLDTNVIVRYVTQDDPVQARAATNFIESLTEHITHRDEFDVLTGGHSLRACA